MRRVRGLLLLMVVLALAGAGVFYALRKTRAAAPVISTAPAVRGELELMVKTRGEVKAVRSVTLNAPSSVTDVQIIRLARGGAMVREGDVIVEIDTTQEQDRFKERQSVFRQADAELEKMRAQHRIQDEQDRLDLARAQFDVEAAKLDVRKQEIVSEIDAGKAKLALLSAERRLAEVNERIEAHQHSQAAEIDEVLQKRKKAESDVQLAGSNIERLTIRSPLSGFLQILPNFRAGGGFGGGRTVPEFKQGDRAWPGAAIAEIPNLNLLAVELQVEETDRGKVSVGQQVRLKVDAFSDQALNGKIQSISPTAQVDYSNWPPQKTFRAMIELDMAQVKELKAKAPVGGGPGGAGPAGPRPAGQAAAGQQPAGAGAGQAAAGQRTAAPTAQTAAVRTAGGEGDRTQVRRVERAPAEASAGQAGTAAPAAGAVATRQQAAPSGEQRQGAPAGGRVVPRAAADAPGGPADRTRGGPAPARAVPAGPPPKPPEHGLRPGMSATGEVLYERVKDVLLIPVRASFDRGGKVVVYVKNGRGFEPREITVGRRNEAQIEVVSGLNAGDVVALEEPPGVKGKL